MTRGYFRVACGARAVFEDGRLVRYEIPAGVDRIAALREIDAALTEPVPYRPIEA